MIIKAAFIVNSSLLLIYSEVPSIGSTNQKSFKFLLFLFFEVSSETTGILGVNLEILSNKILLTAKSPFVTGVLSSFISFFKPFNIFFRFYIQVAEHFSPLLKILLHSLSHLQYFLLKFLVYKF